jgi:uncharacterized protein (DUF1015 family)
VAEVRGFRGLRYAADRVGDLSCVVCPPYDIISEREAAALRATSPYNAICLELPEPEPGDAGGQSRYRRAASELAAWRRDGVLRRDDAPSVYAVEEAFTWQDTQHRRRGLLAAVRLAAWEERIVLPHERTLAAPKADRLELLRACETNISPVFLLHPPQPDAQRALWQDLEGRPPTAEISLPEGRGERLWVLQAESVDLLGAFASSPLYIADGHHRYETALRYRDERRAGTEASRVAGYEYVLSYLVSMDDPGLLVLPTHRCVAAGRIDEERLAGLIGERFDVERRPWHGASNLPAALAELGWHGANQTAFALYRPGELTILRPTDEADRWLPPDRDSAWRALDVAQLESLLLAPLLGPSVAEELIYTRDAAEAVAEVDAGRAALAVLLNPTPPQQIAAVADASERMPQKSTYFYPKLSTGLVFHVLDDVAIM